MGLLIASSCSLVFSAANCLRSSGDEVDTSRPPMLLSEEDGEIDDATVVEREGVSISTSCVSITLTSSSLFHKGLLDFANGRMLVRISVLSGSTR